MINWSSLDKYHVSTIHELMYAVAFRYVLTQCVNYYSSWFPCKIPPKIRPYNAKKCCKKQTNKKNPRATSQFLQASVSMLNATGCDNVKRKRQAWIICKGCQEKASLKRTWQHSLGVKASSEQHPFDRLDQNGDVCSKCTASGLVETKHSLSAWTTHQALWFGGDDLGLFCI